VAREARVVLGAVASTPREAPDAVRVLVGQRLSRDVIAQAAERAAGPSKPLDNTDFTHPYRKKVTRVFVERALLAIAGLADGGPRVEEIG
jgi:CO/xanthine dehydrogenase FAD-binding subunit